MLSKNSAKVPKKLKSGKISRRPLFLSKKFTGEGVLQVFGQFVNSSHLGAAKRASGEVPTCLNRGKGSDLKRRGRSTLPLVTSDNELPTQLFRRSVKWSTEIGEEVLTCLESFLTKSPDANYFICPGSVSVLPPRMRRRFNYLLLLMLQ